MTLLDVVFKYGTPPGEKEMGALNNAWGVDVASAKSSSTRKSTPTAWNMTLRGERWRDRRNPAARGDRSQRKSAARLENPQV